MTEQQIKILSYTLMIIWVVVVFLWNFKEVLKDKYLHISVTQGRVEIIETRHDVIDLRYKFVIDQYEIERIHVDPDYLMKRYIHEAQDKILDQARGLIEFIEQHDKYTDQYPRSLYEVRLRVVNPIPR